MDKKEYNRKYYLDNKKKSNERSRIYHQEHKKEINERSRKYNQDHRKELNERAVTYRKGKKEEIKQYNRKYYQDHKEKAQRVSIKYQQEHKVQSKQWRQTHWDFVLVSHCKYSDKKFNRECNITTEFIHKMLHHQTYRCFYCDCVLSLINGNRLHNQASVDRVDNSFGHVISNCVMSCISCNDHKKSQTLEKFMLVQKYTILKE